MQIGEENASSILRTIPEFPNDGAFFLRFWMDVGSLQDTDGRRLHEVDFRDEIEPDEYTPCKFKDSRQGYLINETAFKQMGANWDSTLQIASRLATIVNQRRSNKKTAFKTAWHASVAGMFIPVFLNKRPQSELFGKSIPLEIASFFKINLDLPTTLDLMMLDDDLYSHAHHAPSEKLAKLVGDFANRSNILINSEFACAGPQKLIEDYVEAVSTPTQSISHEKYLTFLDNEFERFAVKMGARYVVGYWFGLFSGLFVACYRTDLRGSIDAGYWDQPSAYSRRTIFALSRLFSRRAYSRAKSRFLGLFEEDQKEYEVLVNFFSALSDLHPAGLQNQNYNNVQAKLESLTLDAISQLNELLIKEFQEPDVVPLDLTTFWPDLPRNMK